MNSLTATLDMKEPQVASSDLSPGETAILFPSFGHWDVVSQNWKVTVSGVILEPGIVGLGKRLMVKLFRRLLGKKLLPEESEIFQQRIRDFAAGTERGKRVIIRVGDERFLLQKKTKRNGHFSGSFRLSPDELHRLEQAGQFRDGWLTIEIVTPDNDSRTFVGQAMLVKGAGFSIISDIDDTVKLTEVTDRDSLLANTFLRRFQSIDGMAMLYRTWADSGASFHYVSSSPWQLYRPLSELLNDEGFPAGTFHLRAFRLRDHMLRKIFRIRRQGKLAVMKSIVRAFPNRQFVLVGDSGERDPELYGRLARKFPDQIAAILIRQIPGNRLDISRCMKAFRNVPPDLWQVFEGPDQLSSNFQLNGEKAPLATRE